MDWLEYGDNFSGIVKLGIHCKTKEKAAIKIINKQKLKTSVLQKVSFMTFR